MRTNKWLLQTTRRLWQKYFRDLPIQNDILVTFSRRNKYVLGSIRYDRQKKMTLIRINGHFRNERIPIYVVRATLAHEITHYAHGFSAPGEHLYRYPHQGGVVSQELSRRGLALLEKKSKKWLRTNWPKVIKK